MFATQMIEQRNGVVEVEDDNYEDFYQLIQYLYMAKVDDGYDRFEELLVLADKYEVKRLGDLCAKRIKETLREDNVLDLGMFGEMHNSDVLVKSCATFMSSRMFGCLKQGDFDKIEKSPKLMKELLRILTNNEEDKFNTVSRFENEEVKFNTVSRFEKSSVKVGWEHSGNIDAIKFRVSSPVALVGIGLYGSTVDKELDVEISIYRNEVRLQTLKTKLNSKGSPEPVKIRLSSPVTVEAEKIYEVVTKIQGGKTFYSSNGNSVVVMNSEEGNVINRVTFIKSSKSRNSTGVMEGQIPCLLLRSEVL